jgi:Uma2 family endonuclease
MTAEELALLTPDHVRTELVRGRMVLREASFLGHGKVSGLVAAAINVYLYLDQLERGARVPRGSVLIAHAGFTLERKPDTVRAPDVSYVHADRLTALDPDSFAELAPDLVVEVRSRSNRVSSLRAKVAQFLRAGSRLVWVIDPKGRSATVYRADGTISVIAESGALNGEDVLPGCVIPLPGLFE